MINYTDIVTIVISKDNSVVKTKRMKVNKHSPKSLGEVVGYLSACEDIGCDTKVI